VGKTVVFEGIVLGLGEESAQGVKGEGEVSEGRVECISSVPGFKYAFREIEGGVRERKKK